MAQFSRGEILEALVQRDPKALQDFFEHYASSYYSFCLLLCLGHVRSAKSLFEKTLKRALKTGAVASGDLDQWFYSHLHVTWISFSRFNKRQRAKKRKLKLDWAQLLGQQHKEALDVLGPLAREVLLHRMVNKYSAEQIQKFIGVRESKIHKAFAKAAKRVGQV